MPCSLILDWRMPFECFFHTLNQNCILIPSPLTKHRGCQRSRGRRVRIFIFAVLRQGGGSPLPLTVLLGWQPLHLIFANFHVPPYPLVVDRLPLSMPQLNSPPWMSSFPSYTQVLYQRSCRWHPLQASFYQGKIFAQEKFRWTNFVTWNSHQIFPDRFKKTHQNFLARNLSAKNLWRLRRHFL